MLPMQKTVMWIAEGGVSPTSLPIPRGTRSLRSVNDERLPISTHFMNSFREAFKFFYEHFFALTLAVVLLGAPEFFLVGNFLERYPGLLTATDLMLVLVLLVLLALFAPFRQAGLIVVMNAKRLGKTVTGLETLQAGLRYWQPLFGLNLVRMFLIVFLVVVVSFISKTAPMAGQPQSLWVLMVVGGTFYMIVRFAYFDALIVLESRTALEALTLSMERTATNWALLWSVIGLTLGFLFLRMIAFKFPDPLIAQILGQGLLPMLWLCSLHVVCFTFFWNTRPKSQEGR